MIDRDKFYFYIFCTTFWVVSCFGFVSQEILPFLQDGHRSIMLLADVVVVVLGLVTLKNRTDRLLILAFLAIVAISNLLLNRLSLIVTVNGIRDYVPYIFSLPIIRFLLDSNHGNDFRQSFDRQLYIFLLLQAVCVTEQFFRYGAGDHGGGTMGNYSSGPASISIILISFYFVSKNWDYDNYLRSLWNNRLYIILLYPVFLNETKISFVLLAIYFILLYRFNLKSFGKIFLALPFIAVVAVGFYVAYIKATDQEEMDVASSDFIETYLTGGADAEDVVELAHNAEDYDMYDETWGYEDLPRFLKIGFLFPVVDEDTAGGLWFGGGVGHFKGGTFLEPTPLAKEYHWLIGGTNPMLFIMVFSLGIFGLIWYIVWFIHTIAFRQANGPSGIRIKVFLGLIILILLFYNDSIRYYPLPFIFFYFALISGRKEDEPDAHDSTATQYPPHLTRAYDSHA